MTFLGAAHAVVQAPMAGANASAMAIAVCRAGGLGSLPCATLTAEQIERELRAITAATDRAYNVNFFCHDPIPVDQEIADRWLAVLAPYLAEYGVEPDPAAVLAPARAPFSHDVADVVEPYRPPVVSFHFGLPATDLLTRVRSWGSHVIASATTVAEARWLAERGVDAVIAQGVEAGGHRGIFLTPPVAGDWQRATATQLGTMALVPQVAAAVDCPVIAAGGIVGPDTVRAAIALGATAVQAGTAYLLCPEALTSPLHRAALADPASVTALTNVLTGRPARGIVNRLMAELGPIHPDAPPFPFASGALTALRAAAEAAGRTDATSLWSGQNATGCRAVPATEITESLVAGLPG